MPRKLIGVNFHPSLSKLTIIFPLDNVARQETLAEASI